MKELIKLSHIETEITGGFQLRDFNLTIGSGEIVYLVADTDVEKYLIKNILTGRIDDFRGSFYLGNRRQTEWDQNIAYENGIFYVDERHQLAAKLNIMENVCAIRRTSAAEIVINRLQDSKRTAEILELVGLEKRPNESIEFFSHFERQLVCIAKMIYSGARLLIFDGLENKYSIREILHIQNLVKILSEMDIAVLFLQRQPEEILSVCTKCVLVWEGCDGKILFPPEITREMIAEYRFSHSQSAFKSVNFIEEQKKINENNFVLKNPKGEEQRYHIIGYYDIDLDSSVHFREYLQQLNENTVQVSIAGKTLRERLDHQGDTLMISMDSVEELMYNLNLGENLAFVFRNMEKRKPVFIKPRFCTYLRMEFLKKFGIRQDVKSLDELRYYEKKLLSIYRWLQVGNVESIFLEEPYLNLQEDEMEKMKQYLLEVSREHAPLGIFSKNVFDLSDICDAIIVSCKGQFLKYYEKDEFGQIMPETAKMIREMS